ncbi:VOC family protein [Deinococcus sp.]|uniref:VOC family protein n=1 Tax=Deinococcus sp. TaxID=47478 RepID=UPI003B5C2BBC
MRPNLLLYTPDVERAADFYQRLGFTLRRRNRNGGWTELEFGTLLLFFTVHRACPLSASAWNSALKRSNRWSNWPPSSCKAA